MKRSLLIVLISIAPLLSACGIDKKDAAYEETAGRYLQAQHDYCSTNMFVAVKGLAEYRQWLSDTNHPCKPWFKRNQNLFQVNARLFTIKESLGETQMADYFYKEAAQSYVKFLKDSHLADHMLSKEEMRDLLARQEKGLNVGWKKSEKQKSKEVL